MCGRFTLTAEPTLLAERFAIDLAGVSWQPSYNIAPSQPVLAIINDGTIQASQLRWGLIPSWAKDPGIGNRMINARSETVAEKPSFRSALQRRRCLVLADGFFEWRQDSRGKTPMYIRLHDHRPFAFAGLWDTWHDAAGTPLRSCTILTTEANTRLQPIRQRMPVILPPTAEATWLDHGVTTPTALLPLLVPYASEAVEAYAVSPLVNSPRNNTPACVAPVTLSEGNG